METGAHPVPGIQPELITRECHPLRVKVDARCLVACPTCPVQELASTASHIQEVGRG